MSIFNNLRRIWLEAQIRFVGDEVVKANQAGDLVEAEWQLNLLEKLYEEHRSTL